MNTIIGELGKSNKFVDLSKQIEKTQSPISISGLTGVGMAEIISAIKGYNKKPILLVIVFKNERKNFQNCLQWNNETYSLC